MLSKKSSGYIKYTKLENRVINACHFLICPTRQRLCDEDDNDGSELEEVLTINDFCFCTFRKLSTSMERRI